MTLAELVAEQHDALVVKFVEAARRLPESAGLDRIELLDSMAFFLDDLVEALASEVTVDRETSAAASHGVERLSIGFRIDRVVREYLLVAQQVLDLADEFHVHPTARELRTLMRAVGDGGAIAAGEYIRRREADILAREAEHAGFLAHEVRNALSRARFAFDLLRRRDFADPGSLVQIIDSGLRQAGREVDDALAGARLRGGVVSQVRVFIGLMVQEIAAELRPQAEARQIAIVIDAPPRLAAQADPRLLRSALNNLVQNAIKFSRSGGTVSLRARGQGGELLVDVEDACGGIAPDKIEQLFRPFVQAGEERSGFGLGLAIARECIEVQGGALRLRNVPEHGCVFTVALPLRGT